MRHGLAPESGQEQAQENSEPCQEAPEVISGGGEHGVDGVAVAVGEEVAVHAMIVFGVSDDRLDGGAAFELSSDGVGDAALLALRVNLELVLFRGVMAFVAGVGEDAGEDRARYCFDAGKDGLERMPVIGSARKSLGVEDELAAF